MRDRLSFVRFLGLTLEDKVPTPRPCGCREELSQAGVIDALFNDFDGYLNGRPDHLMRRLLRFPNSATAVSTPGSSKARRPGSGRTSRPGVVRKTRMRLVSYGYKNHLNIDRRHKLIRRTA